MSRSNRIEIPDNLLSVLTDAFVLRTKKLPNGCLEWQGETKHGLGTYGMISMRSNKETIIYAKAHRVSWLLFVGPIPDGILVLHDCPCGDNPSCVNPSHLWLGTQSDNMRDKFAKGRANLPIGQDRPMAKLADELVREIRRLYAAGIAKKALARKFGVNPSSIRDLISGRSWKHVS